MFTLLFDIDGTLLRTRGAGLEAIRHTMQEMFDISSPLPQVSVHGRTDCGILTDVFTPFGLDFEKHRQTFLSNYSGHLQRTLPEFEGGVLPGVVPLLERLSSRDDVTLGLLTGNCRQAALIKIEHFQLQSYFCGLGGFGDQSTSRNEVARDALRAVRQRVQESFREDRLWVIGDTVDDITCARAIDAKSMVVETGGCSAEELKNGEPDVCLEDLSDVEAVLGHWSD
ncbi:MAG: HAD hydrolase-like protein [Mariniblastus sp.]|nr:HAD hydrolase-like protein [Mariniblastus sp.]